MTQWATLAAALYGRDRHWLPDNGAVAGLVMMAALAPLLLLQGLGGMPRRTLLLWAAGAAVFLFGLGVYQHWRAAGDASPSGIALTAMAGAILFIGQSLLLAHGGRENVRYRALYRASWGLTIQLMLCGLCAGALWMVWRVFPITGFAALAILTVAAALIMQFLDRLALRRIEAGLVYILTGTLPFALVFSMLGILLWSLTHWLPPLAFSAAAAALIIVGINASYRDGEWRPQWRRRLEFAGALLLLPLVTLCALALQMRVAGFGFTDTRVMALALVLLLSAYALVYAGAALISLGGGRAMERIETANLVMAFVVISVLTAMATPLADPVRLAVAEQSWRLSHGIVAPDKFDCRYLRKSGLRFGREALAHLPAPPPPPPPPKSSAAP